MIPTAEEIEKARLHMVENMCWSEASAFEFMEDFAQLIVEARQAALEDAANLADGCIGRDCFEVAERIRELR